MSVRHCVSWCAALFAAALAACSRSPGTARSFPNAPVVLISIDTLRADHLPAYGYGGVATPALDRFRRDAILFRHAYAQAPMTLPSHVSMLTGLLPFEHGVRDNVGFAFDAKRFASVPTSLHARGYATGAAVSSYVLRAETGLAAAFDWYDDAVDPRSSSSFSEYQRPGDRTAAVAQKWIDAHASSPFFFFLHLYEPHVPYEPAEPFRARYADRPYDGEIATVDAIVGRFLDHLKSAGIYDRALIVITSDHGEGLGDHGEQQHSILIYNELIHVPLFVKLPKSEMAGKAVDANVSLTDIAATIVPKLGSGHTLLDTTDSRSIYSESYYARLHLGWSELRSLVSGSMHFIDSSRPELYGVRNDPREQRDLVSINRRDVAKFRQELAKLGNTLPQPAPVDPETSRRLAALGYLSGASTAAAGPLPNPRDRIADFERLRSALQMIAAGHESEGRRLFDDVARANPRMSEAWVQLAETYTRNGDLDRAMNAYREALARSSGPADEIVFGMAEIELQRGNINGAASLTRGLRNTNRRRVDALHVRLSLARRDYAAAEKLARGLAESPGALPADRLLLAEVLLRSGRLDDASGEIDRAVDASRQRGEPLLYRADFLRAEIYAQREQPREAIAAYQREIAAFPDDLVAYAHLAVMQFVTGDRAAMNRTLEQMVSANPRRPAFLLAASTLESVEDMSGAASYRRRAGSR